MFNILQKNTYTKSNYLFVSKKNPGEKHTGKTIYNGSKAISTSIYVLVGVHILCICVSKSVSIANLLTFCSWYTFIALSMPSFYTFIINLFLTPLFKSISSTDIDSPFGIMGQWFGKAAIFLVISFLFNIRLRKLTFCIGMRRMKQLKCCKLWHSPQVGRLHGIKRKAAISLAFDLCCKVIAALFLIPHFRPI